MYTDAIAAATRRQSDAEITHMFKNQNQGTLWTWYHYKHTSFTSMRNNRTTISHRKITTYRFSPESDARAAAQTNSQPATAGTLGERGCGGPSAQVLILYLDNWGHKTPMQSRQERKDKRVMAWNIYTIYLVTLTLVGKGTEQVTTSACSPKHCLKQEGLYHEVPHLSLLQTHSSSDPSQGTGQTVTCVQRTGRPTHNAFLTEP